MKSLVTYIICLLSIVASCYMMLNALDHELETQYQKDLAYQEYIQKNTFE